MKQRKTIQTLSWTLIFGLATSGIACAANAGPYWVSLFDGETLAGWHQEGDGDWVVEDGAIVGKTQKAAKLYGLLVSDEVYSDFTLRLKFKSLKGNSGFYIRMVVEKPDKAHGLQIEVDPRHNSGGIYESYRRAWVSKPTEKSQHEYFKPDEWNDLEIAADGGDVTVKVNGVISAQVTDDPSRPAGQLAMQMHSGNEMLVMFKDIEIHQGSKSNPIKSYGKIDHIQPNAQGEIVLSALAAQTDRGQFAYVSGWDALKFYSDNGEAVWKLERVKPGTYDVFLEWSATSDYAGNVIVLQAGGKQLESPIESTGSSQVYRIKQIGRLTLEPGTESITLKAPQLNVRELRLVPVPL
ncbi:3-keto-disaccharide hydrolase [Bythopirellula polymerisocia]|uniref:3-keto-alpha-glucoside-1,2-lyase/3-keto-2-hydroxy-glucal hydratase domain-containing protein n=1 Tax=Bythopirellula polymerisocia TaxID=2528003 RepID=A0A5C6CPB7_9BACT|nr:DUF1080 domain-containing protein [Bythopirellula polymerisocia]TWU24579.1 hypothetical protein Pla144_34640 [Bythopirellula polymerisocia]